MSYISCWILTSFVQLSRSIGLNDAVHVFSGGLSAADWSVRRIGGGGSMPTTDGTTAAAAAALTYIPSSRVTLRGRQSKVLENRDLCRIVTSYSIPKKRVDFYSIELYPFFLLFQSCHVVSADTNFLGYTCNKK